jgi:hypothetical protein
VRPEAPPDAGTTVDEVEHDPAVVAWLDGGAEPDRRTVAAAVRASLRALAATAPGRSVEVRVPPFAAVQCIAGPRHTRGNPSNVVQTDPRTWLQLATGRRDFGAAVTDGAVSASGTRAAEVARYLPLEVPIPGRG